VVNGSRVRVEDEETGGDGVADDRAKPGLPPGHPCSYHRGTDHEGVEIEAIREPEGPVVPAKSKGRRETKGQPDLLSLEPCKPEQALETVLTDYAKACAPA
jgi:hypothetical protein